jgi:uncharacterized membrane protein YgcG
MVYYTIMKKIVVFTLIAVFSIALVVAARHYLYPADNIPYSSTDNSGFTNGRSGGGGGGGGGGSLAE